MIKRSTIQIGKQTIGEGFPVYFIADIAANHDGSLIRAKDLIKRAKEAGANCAKFQHFLAAQIVSDYGFRQLTTPQSHQSSWKKTVFEVYKEYECRREWTAELAETAKENEIEFMSTPYDFESVCLLNPFVNAYKIGSGDINWLEFLEIISNQEKTVLLATGASTLAEVKRAVATIQKRISSIVLMQCNTNYTGNDENYRNLNLNVLRTFAKEFPDVILGLSDHTLDDVSVVAAVSMGAKVIEKHFTDDNSRTGPDHHFAMNPKTWKKMVRDVRILESALGDGIKKIEDNEQETVVIQRRSIRMKHDTPIGHILCRDDLDILRPAPAGSLAPDMLSAVLGKKLLTAKKAGENLLEKDLVR